MDFERHDFSEETEGKLRMAGVSEEEARTVAAVELFQFLEWEEVYTVVCQQAIQNAEPREGYGRKPLSIGDMLGLFMTEPEWYREVCELLDYDLVEEVKLAERREANVEVLQRDDYLLRMSAREMLGVLARDVALVEPVVDRLLNLSATGAQPEPEVEKALCYVCMKDACLARLDK